MARSFRLPSCLPTAGPKKARPTGQVQKELTDLTQAIFVPLKPRAFHCCNGKQSSLFRAIHAKQEDSMGRARARALYLWKEEVEA